MWRFVDLALQADGWHLDMELWNLTNSSPPTAHTLYMTTLCIFTAVTLKQYLPQLHKGTEKWTKNTEHKSILKK